MFKRAQILRSAQAPQSSASSSTQPAAASQPSGVLVGGGARSHIALSYAALIVFATGAVTIVQDVWFSHRFTDTDKAFLIGVIAFLLALALPFFGIVVAGTPYADAPAPPQAPPAPPQAPPAIPPVPVQPAQTATYTAQPQAQAPTMDALTPVTASDAGAQPLTQQGAATPSVQAAEPSAALALGERLGQGLRQDASKRAARVTATRVSVQQDAPVADDTATVVTGDDTAPMATVPFPHRPLAEV